MRLASLMLFVLASSATAAAAQTPAPQDADAIYKARCASCHEAGVARAPNRDGLRRLTPEAIGAALTTGSMREQGQDLTLAQIQLLARALGSAPATGTPEGNACTANDSASLAKPLEQPNWNGWGANLAQHRFQPAAMARLSANDVPRLKLKWAFAFQGVNRAFAQPTVVGGRVFVGSASNAVYSLNANSGCQYWAFKPDAPVRTAITIGPGMSRASGSRTSGISEPTPMPSMRKLAHSSGSDRSRASRVPTITGAPTLADGTLYVVTSSAEEVLGANPKYECCRFRGSISALNAATGEVRWKSFTIAEEPKPVRKNAQGVQLWGPSGSGVWSSPAVDLKRGVVYITTGDAYSDPAGNTSDAFMAFDIKTGKLLWTRQVTSGDAFNVACGLPEAFRVNCPEAKGPDHDFGSSPILVDLPNGRRALIAGQKSGVVHAVDPDRGGEILWQTRVGKGSALGGVQWGSAFDGRRVYVALSDVIPETAGTAAAPPTPPGQAPPPNTSGGGLFALDPASGQIVWTTPHPGCGDRPGCSPAQSAAVTAIPGIVFSGGIDGHLRAYASRQWRDRLGCGHGAAVPDRERRHGQRRFARRTRPGRRWRHGVREFRIRVRCGEARQRAARVLCGRAISEAVIEALFGDRHSLRHARRNTRRHTRHRGTTRLAAIDAHVGSWSWHAYQLARLEVAVQHALCCVLLLEDGAWPTTPLTACVSRRDVLKRVGVAGAAAAVPIDAIAQATREPFETLTAAEGATLEAIVARLIPTDANGPGAAEARAARYIDRALGGFLASFLVAYRAGLAAIESLRSHGEGRPFTQLSAQDQDAVLTDMENNAATGIRRTSAVLQLVLSHTSRARSAIRSTAATRTSSAGISSAIRASA